MSVYDDNEYKSFFYGDVPTNHTKTVIKKSLEEQLELLKRQIAENERQLKELAGVNRKNEAKAMSPPKKTKDDAIREIIKMAAMGNHYNPIAPKTNPPKEKPSVPIINDVVEVNDIRNFTDQTHNIYVHLIDNDYYSEVVETKVVGMETVDWWEYVLIYGIFKHAKVAFEYAQMSDLIKNGSKSTRTVSGKKMEVYIQPKVKFVPKQTYDVVDGKTVIRETGIKYGSERFSVEIPLNKVEKINEYRKGYFIFEEKYNTLEPDINKLFHEFGEMVASKNINEELIKIGKQQIITYGRLSRV